VLEAIRAGRFHVYPITHIDQGLALLTGVPAGDPTTEDTVHGMVNARLRQLAQDIAAFGNVGRDGARSHAAEAMAAKEEEGQHSKITSCLRLSPSGSQL